MFFSKVFVCLFFGWFVSEKKQVSGGRVTLNSNRVHNCLMGRELKMERALHLADGFEFDLWP